jgi:hypothetical protein
VIRARFTDYVQRFVRLASRYDEETGISTSVGYPCASFVYGELATLGGGILFADEQAAARELTANIGRIEGWRATPSYGLYKEVRVFRVERTMITGDLSLAVPLRSRFKLNFRTRHSRGLISRTSSRGCDRVARWSTLKWG